MFDVTWEKAVDEPAHVSLQASRIRGGTSPWRRPHCDDRLRHPPTGESGKKGRENADEQHL